MNTKNGCVNFLEKFSRQFNATGVVVVHELLEILHRSAVHRKVNLVVDLVLFGCHFCKNENWNWVTFEIRYRLCTKFVLQSLCNRNCQRDHKKIQNFRFEILKTRCLTGFSIIRIEEALLAVDHQVDVEHSVIEDVHVGVPIGNLLQLLGHRHRLRHLRNRALIALLLLHQLIVRVAEDRLL